MIAAVLAATATSLDHLFAEDLVGEGAVGEKFGRIAQGVRYARQMLRLVDIALKDRRRLNLVFDAVETRSEGSGEDQIGIAVGARNAAFDAQHGRQAVGYHCQGPVRASKVSCEKSAHFAFIRSGRSV